MLVLDKIVMTGAMRGVSESDAAVAKRTMEAKVLPSFVTSAPSASER
jgi:hypothetical protein